jgi:hypothetical protein
MDSCQLTGTKAGVCNPQAVCSTLACFMQPTYSFYDTLLTCMMKNSYVISENSEHCIWQLCVTVKNFEVDL